MRTLSGNTKLRQQGFTLIELLVTVMLASVLLALSFMPIRSFWFAQSVKGASDVLVGELRKAQEDSVSQSHPLIFGVGFTAGAARVIVYRFDPLLPGATDDTCSASVRPFDSGVFNATVVTRSFSITNDTTAQEYVKCQEAFASDRIMFFYARGTSTGGTVVLEQPNSLKQRSVAVSPITGRVTRT